MQTLITYVAEDNPTVLSNLIETLGEIAHLEVAAWSATESETSRWLEWHEANWHLAIVDLFLKQGTGLGILAACRKRKSYQKIVILTNYATPEIRLRSAALGADAVFDKSTELDDMLAYCIAHTRNLMQEPVPEAQGNAVANKRLLN